VVCYYHSFGAGARSGVMNGFGLCVGVMSGFGRFFEGERLSENTTVGWFYS